MVELPSGTNDPAADFVVVVFRDGAPSEMGALDTWARSNPPEAGHDDPNVLAARALAPGRYEACRVPKAEFVRWMEGSRDPTRCATGHLGALGALDLRIPSR